MRGIKFRAWHLHENKMYDVYNLDLLFGRCWSKERRECLLGCDIELMQYTGLKDKNGKEIYEGDIIMIAEDYKPYHVVEWHKKFGCYILKSTIEKGYCYMFSDIEKTFKRHGGTSTLKVVGNVYENPELLTV